jgi:hypothetical protein
VNARRIALIVAGIALVATSCSTHTATVPSARPAMICQAERSDTAEGVEIIAYPAGAARSLGVVVACPQS